jgi:mannan endo-1,4-beta-mannosidase
MKDLKFIQFLIAVLSTILMQSCTQKPVPVNPNTTKEARELLTYLYEIAGENTLSGQHNYAHQLTRSTDTVISITGKTPVVWGFELRNGIGWEPTIDEAIRQHDQGAILTGMSHMSRPFDGPDVHRSTWQKLTDEQWEEMLTPGTELYGLLITRMDKIADGLLKLQENNIPVLWRPFHEMNGVWFWWGNRPGPEGFERLWKLMYDRYTHHHGLNNLIWVWNPNAPRDWEDDEAYDYHLFYPGHEYVDVLAADVYKNDFKQSHHDDMLALANGKPIALGEVGELPSPEILEQQPMWTWFMCWANWIWTHNTPEHVKELYDSPRILSLDDI